jgi:hypothetical protein
MMLVTLHSAARNNEQSKPADTIDQELERVNKELNLPSI